MEKFKISETYNFYAYFGNIKIIEVIDREEKIHKLQIKHFHKCGCAEVLVSYDFKLKEYENLEIEHSDYPHVFWDESEIGIFETFEIIKNQIIEGKENEKKTKNA